MTTAELRKQSADEFRAAYADKLGEAKTDEIIRRRSR
jgi:hypothetical protein